MADLVLTFAPVDPGHLEDCIRGVLCHLVGLDAAHYHVGLQETPARVAKALLEMTSGYGVNVPDLFKTFEDGKIDQMVMVRDIDFHSMCEHHLLPFIGVAHVAYIPDDGRVIGLSKVARVVDAYAKRLQVQERLTDQITAAFKENMRLKGVACVVEAKHLCMACRGVKKPNATMVTSSVVGCFRDEPETRAEFFTMIGLRR